MPNTIGWGTSIQGSGVGQGVLLGMPGVDGITDGINTIQGERAYDASAGIWTTPDAYGGTVGSPLSQKSYVWNGNNPVDEIDVDGNSPCAIFQSLFAFGDMKILNQAIGPYAAESLGSSLGAGLGGFVANAADSSLPEAGGLAGAETGPADGLIVGVLTSVSAAMKKPATTAGVVVGTFVGSAAGGYVYDGFDNLTTSLCSGAGSADGSVLGVETVLTYHGAGIGNLQAISTTTYFSDGLEEVDTMSISADGSISDNTSWGLEPLSETFDQQRDQEVPN